VVPQTAATLGHQQCSSSCRMIAVHTAGTGANRHTHTHTHARARTHAHATSLASQVVRDSFSSVATPDREDNLPMLTSGIDPSSIPFTGHSRPSSSWMLDAVGRYPIPTYSSTLRRLPNAPTLCQHRPVVHPQQQLVYEIARGRRNCRASGTDSLGILGWLCLGYTLHIATVTHTMDVRSYIAHAGEQVLCYHGPMLYSAKVVRICVHSCHRRPQQYTHTL
jgi:hypothetical protein